MATNLYDVFNTPPDFSSSSNSILFIKRKSIRPNMFRITYCKGGCGHYENLDMYSWCDKCDPPVEDHFCVGRSQRYVECQYCHPHVIRFGSNWTVDERARIVFKECLKSPTCKYTSEGRSFRYVFYRSILRKYTAKDERAPLNAMNLIAKINHAFNVRKLFINLKVSYLCKQFIVKRMFIDLETFLRLT